MRFVFFFYLSILFTFSLDAKPLIFGIVPQQSPLELKRDWQPVIDYLQKATGEKIVFKTERSIPEFEKMVSKGQYDIVYMNPSHYVGVHKTKGYTAFARDQKMLVGILVVRKDSGITSLSQARGKQFLFPAPGAFAATMINKYELLESYGIDLEADKNFRYVNSHDSVYKGVARGFGDIGGGIERTLNDLDDVQTKNALTIVHKTKSYPSHPFVFNPTLSVEKQHKIKKALMQIPDTLLTPLKMKHLIETDDSEYSGVRKMVEQIEKKK